VQPTGPDTNGTSVPPPSPSPPSSVRLGDPRPSIDALLEPPDPNPTGGSLTVDRSFAFVDICGFTAYCEHSGEQLALELLIEFRQVVRDVVARRGVRVSKWLGDGVMIVSLEPAILAAACAEIELRCASQGLDTHAGIATGSVLLLEGDDYVGRTVNLAARLCEAAQLGQTLAANALPELPAWLYIADTRMVDVAGMGEPVAAHLLAVDDSVRDAFANDPYVA
jgi:adenylate cyclase